MDRRFEQLFEREGSEKLVGAAHACGDSWHANGTVPYGIRLVLDFVYSVAFYRLADDSEHVGGCGPRRAVAVIDGDAATGVAVVLGGHVDDHLTVAGDGGACGLDDV